MKTAASVWLPNRAPFHALGRLCGSLVGYWQRAMRVGIPMH